MRSIASCAPLRQAKRGAKAVVTNRERMMRGFAALMALVMSATSPAVMAQSEPPPVATQQERATMQQVIGGLERLLKGEPIEAELLSPGFLAAVPPAQLRAIIASIKSDSGGDVTGISFEMVSARSANLVAAYPKADVLGQITIGSGPSPKIEGLLFTGSRVRGDSLSAIGAEIDALPGKAGFALVRLDGPAPRTIATAGDSGAYPLGSIFKLYVLDELAHQVAAGRLRWDSVLPINAKSFPSGVLQKWPDNAPVTVATAAIQMISISDNTATDLLIGLVGREAIEARIAKTGHSAPDRMLPFLTTVEAFALKMPQNADLRARFTAASEAQQRDILESERSRLTLDAIDIARLEGNQPLAINDIEWFADHADLVDLLARLGDHQDPMVRAIMAINPALPPEDARRWAYVGYKGGSEPGVVATAWLLEAADGRRFALVGGQHDAENNFDNTGFINLMMRIANLAAEAR